MTVEKINKRVLLLLAEGFELIETSCFTDVLAWASFLDNVDITLTSVSTTGSVRAAFGGFTVSTDAVISDIDLSRFDALAIPGGMEWAGFFNDALAEDFTRVVAHFLKHSKPIAAVCVASTSIAKTGAMAGRKATIYHSPTGKHKASLESMGVSFIDSPIVIDGNVITSTGPGTAVEMALALLGMITDDDTVNVTREMMRIPTPTVDWYQPQVK